MAIMLAKTYNAFRAAGVPEAEVQAAAEELAGYENRLGAVESGLENLGAEMNSPRVELNSLRAEPNGFRVDVTARLNVLTWAIGIDTVLKVAILGVLLRY
jgi:hypothetical protein